MTTEDEEYLIGLIKIDPNEFGKLFDKHYRVILNYIFHRVADYELSRDMASEVFLKAYLHIHSYKYKGIPVVYWLYQIANNEMRQYYRSKKYQPLHFSEAIRSNLNGFTTERFLIDETNVMEKELQLNEDFKLVQQKTETLPIKYQQVIALRYFEHKTIREISLILRKKEGTIKSLLSRGIDKLRNALNHQYD